MTLRQMSISVAAMLQAGKNPATEAALVKSLGTILKKHSRIDSSCNTTSWAETPTAVQSRTDPIALPFPFYDSRGYS
ncbi:MAG: hypothetical protein CM1200mP9_05300 [Gammaproteobacteria bacterium]|nr:MAG: hypothetical protein CM1200mP9_05300 [Gammaproteobacteria bacterium]